jgi:hypothetical protein
MRLNAATFHPHEKGIVDNQATFVPTEPLGNTTEKTICGLRVTTFGLVVVIVVLIIAGTVGGGVGCSLAVKHKPTSCESGVDVPQRQAKMSLPKIVQHPNARE